MTIIKHEMRQGRRSLAIWTASIGFFVAICVFMYPEMKGEMDGVSDMFASMGAFSSAFGLNSLNFGTLIGFYAVECGNILGIGGALFASLIGVEALQKEEKERTAEYLLAHPVSRARIVTQKLLSVLLEIVLLNTLVFALSAASIAITGEEIFWKELFLLHFANLMIQFELAGITFGISAFLRRGGLGVGLGLAIVMYFLNIIANLSESARFLKYITPFGYGEGSDIIASKSINAGMLSAGMCFAAIGITAAYIKYCKKDIR